MHDRRIYYCLLISIFLLGFILRFYKMSVNPPGLYVDEVANGVDAYSILTTGKDQYGQQFPLYFKSFGDYKMPLYIYAISGSMALFGKNEFAIRFPSALAGSLTVIVFYFFVIELLSLVSDKNFRQKFKYVPVLATFLLSISTWHIQFSRGGFEVNLGLFLYLLGTWVALLFWERKKFYFLLLSFLLFVLTVYTYQIFRITSPITLTVLSLFFLWKMPKQRKNLLVIIGLCLLLLVPIFLFSFTSQGQSRLSETSAFAEYPTSNILQKIVLYPMVFLKDYFTFFSFDFLFNFGDGIGRHQIPDFGGLFRWQFPFLLIGLYYFIRSKKNVLTYIIFFLLFTPPIVASLARPSPQTLRSLPMVLPLIILISFGIIYFLQIIPRGRIVISIFLAVFAIYEFVFYLHYYYIHYPRVNNLDWGGGYKETVLKAKEYKSQYQSIVVDSTLDVAPLYFRFYAPELKFLYVGNNWVQPKGPHAPILYIRPNYGIKNNPKIIDAIYLPNVNHDVFSQFWKL